MNVDPAAPLLRVLAGEVLATPPLWIMRQAGRYLPEYRATRETAGSFLALCRSPDLAAEVTLQPIRRFGFDAAIIFSDILVIPAALGQELDFVEGEGPLLGPLPPLEAMRAAAADGSAATSLASTVEAIARVRDALQPHTALIGFCGAPWTVATYMVGRRGGAEQMAARRMALEEPERFAALVEVVADISADYLVAQLRAGADVVKIFDSWAGILDDDGFARWAVAPVARMVTRIRAAIPSARIMGFPRGAGARIRGYAEATGVDAVAVDWATPLALARDLAPAGLPLQGNLDPLRLLVGGAALEEGARAMREAMRSRPWIANLGHGITPDVPVAHVEALVRLIRNAG